VGKTTMLQAFLKQTQLKVKAVTGDNVRTQHLLGTPDLQTLTEFLEGYQLLAIDEAQYIPQIGQTLKLLVDQFPELYIIATGSSSFDLAQETGEPLTGRKRTLHLYPLAQMELYNHYNRYELRDLLDKTLIYGTYPPVLTCPSSKEKQFRLRELAEAYLLKDILGLEQVKASQKLWDLLKILAFRIGSEISHHEIGKKVGLDTKTVGRYLDLLEKGFVIKSLHGFSRNLSNEITKKAKYYFLDTGVRNALINNFNNLADRNDQGALFENFIVMERLKRHNFQETGANQYFWRTHQQQEIDLVEEAAGNLKAFEIKWSSRKQPKPPKAWDRGYPDAEFQVIHPTNYLAYVL
jgi:predicted AAA+ superfamily ATPase